MHSSMTQQKEMSVFSIMDMFYEDEKEALHGRQLMISVLDLLQEQFLPDQLAEVVRLGIKELLPSAADEILAKARAIIHLASKENKSIKTQSSLAQSSLSELPSPLLQSPNRVSMKKSLQRFLQKRKSRAQAISHIITSN
ncbi:hypothetical protein CQW23_19146 [Capsicum baccatum]|uniref:Uncharacterized protein n=1 Tax=Capsicum baccatum TaxID=33114 RepID=A0A2G2W4Y7_CAPBA|nr:hypothetical protein CQW23_19146 [Capsicum baccatum]